MAIIKLLPATKDYLWGGRRLIEEYGKQTKDEVLAETWELSCHPDGLSIVAEGEFQGKTLQEYIKLRGKEVLGTHVKENKEFPILIKFIDAKQDLSIQVHPNDEYALKSENQYGKTELWYILDATEDAFIYYGFQREISKEEIKQRIKEKSLPEVLNKVNVKKGDVFFIEPGTVHTIGAGSLIAEIQQNSNVTYRVYDYGRVGKDGKERELHIDKALDVLNCNKPRQDYEFQGHLATCEYFTVDKAEVQGRFCGKVDETSFVNILVISGKGAILTTTETMQLNKGDSVFVEADSGEYVLEGTMDILITYV